MQFDDLRLISTTLITILCYIYVNRGLEKIQSLFLLLTFCFLYLYSGIGGALKEANESYLWYYAIYMVILSLTIKKSSLQVNFQNRTNSIDKFIQKYGNKIIFLQFFFLTVNLIYPEFKLMNLFSPPPPSLLEHDFENSGNRYDEGLLESVIFLCSSLITPFFYLVLYKYRDKVKYVFFILALSLYFEYCSSGYVGRGSIFQVGLICYLVYYNKISTRKKRILIIATIAVIPFITLLFYWYSFIRLDREMGNVSASDSVGFLLEQEIGYPLHFDRYINNCGKYSVDYLTWLILQPLPGFLKFGLGSFFLNRQFSIQLLGIDVSDSNFYIILPGNVGESIFVFGKYLFILHAIILGVLIKFCIKTFTSSPVFTILIYWLMIQFSYMLARAGTAGVYPMMIKSMLLLVLICKFYKRHEYNY